MKNKTSTTQPVPAVKPPSRRRGFYTRRLKGTPLDGVSNLNRGSLGEESDLLRIFTRQAASMDLSNLDIDDLLKFYQTLSLMLSRISTISRAEKTISHAGEQDDLFRQAIFTIVAQITAARAENK
jgi:hypothetical protein